MSVDLPGYYRDPVQLRTTRDGEGEGREVPYLVDGLEYHNPATALRALAQLEELSRTHRGVELDEVERGIFLALPSLLERSVRVGLCGEGTWRLTWVLLRRLRTHPTFYVSLPESWITRSDGLLNRYEVFSRLAPLHMLAICGVYLAREGLHPHLKYFLFSWLDYNPLLDVGKTFDRVARVLHMVEYDTVRFVNTGSTVLQRYVRTVYV